LQPETGPHLLERTDVAGCRKSCVLPFSAVSQVRIDAVSHAHSTQPRPVPLYQPGSASPADAAAEAQRWLEDSLRGAPPPPVLAVIGLESGHLLDVLAERAPETRVLALEPDPAAAASFRARPVAGRWLSAGRLVYLVDPEYIGSDHAWRILDGTSSHAVLTHPRLAVDTESSVRAARTLKNILFGARANAAARRKFAPRYLVNALRNLPPMLRGRDVQALADAWRGVPAVITAAGPSLDGAIEDLRAVSGRALLIATDTSLRPLLHSGITPPLVVALDPSAANARHFQSLPDCSHTWLVSELALDRGATAVFGERVFWFRAGDHQPWPLLAELGLEAARLDVWGSVLTAAFQVACLAGCDPIVFVGADLAYTGGRPYARGTTYEFDWAWHTGRGMALQDVWREQIARREPQAETDLRGEPAVTTSSLLSFRDWLRARARQSGRRIVNATGAGMLFGDGIEQLPLRDALPASVDIRPLPSLPRRLTPLRPSAIATRLRRLGSAVRAGDREAPIDAWVAFSGEGFDPKAVSAALDDAAQTIETKRAAADPSIPIPWSRLDSMVDCSCFLAQLPEAISRLRTGCQEDGVPLPPDGGQRRSPGADLLLELGLDVLSALAQHAGPGGAPPGELRGANHSVPVSTLYSGPERVRWVVQLIEGLLAHAGAVLPPAGEPSFFARPLRPRDTSRTHARSPSQHERCTTSATLHLLAQWVRCAESLDRNGTVPLLAERLLGLASVTLGADATVGGDTAVVVSNDRSPARLRIPLTVPDAWLARALTGATLDDSADETVLGTAGRTGIRVSVQRATRRQGAGIEPRSPLAPRVLSDQEMPRAAVCYAAAAGVVCHSPESRASFIVGEAGSIAHDVPWPEAATSVLPLGEGGAVAWSWGDVTGGSAPPYLMYRWSPDEDAVVIPLPFRPSRGLWWRGRVYWTCVPTGIGSWSPGTDPRYDLPDLSVAHIQQAKDGLVLVPRVRSADGRIARRLLKEGIGWTPGSATEPVLLGDHGVASCTAASDEWTAAAYPELDLVRIVSPRGVETRLLCYQPLRIAWAGTSLLVSTSEHELVLFPRAMDAIAASHSDRRTRQSA
jgi:hypothetical protein